VTNSTLPDNAGGEGGGGIFSPPQSQSAATTTVKATIVANNTDFEGNPSDCYGGGVVDEGYNLSHDATSGFTSAEHSLSNTPAGLDPAGLGNNSGPTQTIAILPSSLAVDYVPRASLVDPSRAQLKTDQRAFPRPDAHERFGDIGAYEHQD
jgi:hypothetical protein